MQSEAAPLRPEPIHATAPLPPEPVQVPVPALAAQQPSGLSDHLGEPPDEADSELAPVGEPSLAASPESPTIPLSEQVPELWPEPVFVSAFEPPQSLLQEPLSEIVESSGEPSPIPSPEPTPMPTPQPPPDPSPEPAPTRPTEPPPQFMVPAEPQLESPSDLQVEADPIPPSNPDSLDMP
jgi:hypothetical protein